MYEDNLNFYIIEEPQGEISDLFYFLGQKTGFNEKDAYLII